MARMLIAGNPINRIMSAHAHPDPATHLPPQLRREMEARFGTSFEGVRVEESWLPLSVGALACASGERIHVLPGTADFAGERERELLAHELVHVVQQRCGVTHGYSGRCEDPELEQEAAGLGKLAAEGRRVRVWAPSKAAAGGHPVVQCIKTSFQGIAGPKLLQILDQAVVTTIKRAKANVKKSSINGWNVYAMNAGAWTWLAACGKLAVTNSNQRFTWVPCWLNVGPEGTGMAVSGSAKAFSERLEFPTERGDKKDLNYLQIAQQIRALGIDEAFQAEGILWRMTGQPHVRTAGGAHFLNAMVALLFGVESSRNQATLATTLMLLDLVQQRKHYGRQHKVFTLTAGFNSSQGYTWDDGQFASGSLYGGKHPMAVHGTGTGNMRDRYAMTLGKPTGEQVALEMETMNQRHAVPRREISLLVHWLEANINPGVKETLNEVWVTQKIQGRLAQAYFGPNPTWLLPNEPRTDTGQHADLTDYGGVYFYVVDSGKHKVGRNFHADPGCKLIPHNTNYSVEATQSPKILAGMTQCPYCWQHITSYGYVSGSR